MAGSMFMKVDAIDGGVTSKGHETWTNILAWNHGMVMPTSPRRHAAGGASFESCSHSNFTVTKEMDSSTDDFLKGLWSGKHYGKVEFVCYRTVGDTGASQNAVPYLKIELEDAIISDWSVSGSDGSGLPVETMSFNYAKVTYTYTSTEKGSGKNKAAQPVSHDLKDNVVA